MLMSGAGAGLKNAYKRWKEPWDWTKELTYGYKVKIGSK